MKFVLWNGMRSKLTETNVNPFFLSNYGWKGLQKITN